METRKETDLYAPVKSFLELLGYVGKGEVNGCDLVAVRGEQIIVIEMKVAFNLALVLQGIDRQRLTDSVYLAVEAPGRRAGRDRWAKIVRLCRRLGLGLLTVSFACRAPRVEVVCDPEQSQPRRSGKQRVRLLQEFCGRSADHTAGGVSRRPIVTAYRENALRVAAYLGRNGPSPTRAVRAATGVNEVAVICRRDYYGWFERIALGVYRLTPKGEDAVATYAGVVTIQ